MEMFSAGGSRMITRDMIRLERLLAAIAQESKSLVLHEGRSRTIVEAEEQKEYNRLTRGVRRLAVFAAIGTDDSTISAEEQESIARAKILEEEPLGWEEIMRKVDPSADEAYGRIEDRNLAYVTLKEILFEAEDVAVCDIFYEQYDDHHNIYAAMAESRRKALMSAQWRIERREECDQRWEMEADEASEFEQLTADCRRVLSGQITMAKLFEVSAQKLNEYSKRKYKYKHDVDRAVVDYATLLADAEESERRRQVEQRLAREKAEREAEAERQRLLKQRQEEEEELANAAANAVTSVPLERVPVGLMDDESSVISSSIEGLSPIRVAGDVGGYGGDDASGQSTTPSSSSPPLLKATRHRSRTFNNKYIASTATAAADASSASSSPAAAAERSCVMTSSSSSSCSVFVVGETMPALQSSRCPLGSAVPLSAAGDHKNNGANSSMKRNKSRAEIEARLKRAWESLD